MKFKRIVNRTLLLVGAGAVKRVREGWEGRKQPMKRLTLANALVISFAMALMSSETSAGCTWSYSQNISPPAMDGDNDSGTSGASFWSWAFVYYADQFTVLGTMSSLCILCNTSLSKADSGNGTYTVTRQTACANPVEDIEAYARHEFKASAALDDDNNVQCAGHLKIQGAKCSLLCESSGGVALSNTALQEGQTSGTITLTLWGIEVSIQWAMSHGDDLQQVFSHNDSGTGGTTPEVFTCHTDLQLDVNIADNNTFADSGSVSLSDGKAELKVWGTCDGTCLRIHEVISISFGYAQS